MYQEVCFNQGTEAGGGVNVGHSLSPPSHHLCLLRACPCYSILPLKDRGKKRFTLICIFFQLPSLGLLFFFELFCLLIRLFDCLK